MTPDVAPSLNVNDRNTRIKQYHRENRALRTATTINNTDDFGIGRRLCNLPKLREIDFVANRRLLEVERLSHDRMLAEAAFEAINSPVALGRQRALGLRFAGPRVPSLWHAIVLFRWLPDGFRSADRRKHRAPLAGRLPEEISLASSPASFGRLRLHGIIERLPHSFCYRVTGSLSASSRWSR